METSIDVRESVADALAATGSHPLEFLFHPRSVAVVGALSDPRKQGYMFVEQLQLFGYTGRIYPVNVTGDAVLGLPIYRSLQQITEDVDHVISCVPASLVMDLMRQCVEKRVRSVHLYTGRMSETGEEDRRDLEREIVKMARSAGIRVIGPNCLGIYYPREGLSFRYNLPHEAGSVAFISQSGGNGAKLGYRGGVRGVRFSKIVSYGNGCDVDEADLFDYFAHDPETKIIVAYIEGTKDGRRFLSAVERATAKKPVILCKAGRTGSGIQAVSSHTGAMAGSDAVWDAALRQKGVIRVETLDEMLDMIVAFLYFRRPAGRRAGVLGGGGGGSVFAADACESEGLIVPPLPSDIIEQLKVIAPETWVLARNPLDTSAIGPGSMARRGLEMLASHESFDFFIADGGLEWLVDQEQRLDDARLMLSGILEIGRKCPKPMAVVVGQPDACDEWRLKGLMEFQRQAVEAGFAVYPSVERAANAVNTLISYFERRDGMGR